MHQDMGLARPVARPSGQRVAKATTVQRRQDADRENRGDARNRPAGTSGAVEDDEEEDLGPCPNRCGIPGLYHRHQLHHP